MVSAYKFTQDILKYHVHLRSNFDINVRIFGG